MIDEFYLEKIRIKVDIFLTAGDTISGDLFLSPTSRYHQRRETVQEFMNASSRFFILKSDKTVHFINKTAVKYIFLKNKEEEGYVKSESTKGKEVLVNFLAGGSIEGIIPYEPEIYKPRLSDYLSSVECFFYLLSHEGLILLNRDAIKSINEK